MRTKLIANPRSARGRTLASLPDIAATLQRLGVSFDLTRTEAAGQAFELASQAVADGYERLVAVGGDGTCHEVANAILQTAEGNRPVILGIVPAGSGNDLAGALNIPNNLEAACARLRDGSARNIDAGLVMVDGASRFFVNNVGVGLDAEVTIASSKVKRLRGLALYLWSAFLPLAFGGWPYSLRFSLNGEQHNQVITLFTVANGTRVGGGFHLTPDARLDDGLFDVCYATGLSKVAALRLLPRAIKGTHIGHPAVTIARTTHLELFAEDGIPGYVDGEILCDSGRHFELKIMPQALRVWT